MQSVAQDQADRWGSAFTDLFVVLGAFSLFSGMLLIVLVFSLVALERRTELGITRALGARRGDVILLLAIEGGLYSVISSLFGLGGRAGAGAGHHQPGAGPGRAVRLPPGARVEPASIAASYGLGVVLTFVAVSLTAWRSSRFSIVTAIRDLPDPSRRAGWRALAAARRQRSLARCWWASACSHRLSARVRRRRRAGIIGMALLARWLLLRLGLRGPERVVFTLAGLALIGWWLLPLSLFPTVVEMSFLSGVSMLLGAVWVLAYNVGLLRSLRIPPVAVEGRDVAAEHALRRRESLPNRPDADHVRAGGAEPDRVSPSCSPSPASRTPIRRQ